MADAIGNFETVGKYVMYIVNGTVAMLKNITTGEWHPILFRDAPLPGPEFLNKPQRQRSYGHCTHGFRLRSDAIKFIDEHLGSCGLCRFQLDEDIAWDGEGKPCLVGVLVNDRLVCFNVAVAKVDGDMVDGSDG